MNEEFTLQISFYMDVEEMARLHGDRAAEFFSQSGHEFVDELQAFLEAHPFVQACKVLNSKVK